LVLKTSNVFLLVLIGLTLGFSLYNITTMPLWGWDESRNGMNAFEMLQNKDYFNLHYAGKVDNWNSKPPLFIWLVMLCYTIFGTSEFSLRLPSALASLAAMYFVFRLVLLYKKPLYAFFTGITLLTTSGFMGYHVCKTGDFDALLFAFVSGGIYFFVKFIKESKYLDLGFSLLCFVLGFLTKGFAAFLVLPSLFLFLYFQRGWKVGKPFYLFAVCIAFIPVIWILLFLQTGKTFAEDRFAGNSLEMMIVYDLWGRFTGQGYEHTKNWDDYLYIFIYLDSKFHFWYVFLYLSLLWGIIKIRKQGLGLPGFWQKLKSDHLLLLSACFIVPLGLFFCLVHSVNFWYLTPLLPFLAIVSTWSLMKVWESKYLIGKILIVVFCLFSLIFRFDKISKIDEKPIIVKQIEANNHNTTNLIILDVPPTQDVLLYLNFNYGQVKYNTPISEALFPNNHVGLLKENLHQVKGEHKIIAEDDQYVVVELL